MTTKGTVMFASKNADQIGCTCYWTDPSTWFYHYGAAEPGSQMEPNYECFEHFPHDQHNAASPILVAFRAGIEADPENDWITTYLSTLPDWTHGEVGHARKVLTRLAALKEATS